MPGQSNRVDRRKGRSKKVTSPSLTSLRTRVRAAPNLVHDILRLDCRIGRRDRSKHSNTVRALFKVLTTSWVPQTPEPPASETPTSAARPCGFRTRLIAAPPEAQHRQGLGSLASACRRGTAPSSHGNPGMPLRASQYDASIARVHPAGRGPRHFASRSRR